MGEAELIAAIYAHVTPRKERERLEEYLKSRSARQPKEDATMKEGSTMKDPSFILRAAAVVVFILATLGVSPVPMTPLGLALWVASTLVP